MSLTAETKEISSSCIVFLIDSPLAVVSSLLEIFCFSKESIRSSVSLVVPTTLLYAFSSPISREYIESVIVLNANVAEFTAASIDDVTADINAIAAELYASIILLKKDVIPSIIGVINFSVTNCKILYPTAANIAATIKPNPNPPKLLSGFREGAFLTSDFVRETFGEDNSN